MQIDITETNFVRALAAGLLPADEALIRCAQRLVGWLPPERTLIGHPLDDQYVVPMDTAWPEGIDISDDDLRQALRRWCAHYGAPNAAKLLAHFDITNVMQLPLEKRKDFTTACLITLDTVDEFFAKFGG